VMESLGNLCQFLNGGTPAKSEAHFFEGEIPWITSADITGPIAKNARSFITEQAIAASATNKVPAGSVLLVTRTGVGKVAIAEMDLCFSQDITALIPDHTRVDTAYLVHFLRTKQDYFLSMARGATIKGITRNVVAKLNLPLPSLAEQRRIAAILDKADALRTKRREALAQLDHLAQSIFMEMFGEVSQCAWPVEPLDAVLAPFAGSIRTGPFGSQLLHSEFVDEGIAVLGIDNAVANEFRWGERRFITPKKYESLQRYTVRPGDVLITIMGTCGRCAVVPADIPLAINTKHLCCISLDPAKCLPEYLHSYFLWHPMARRYLGQTSKGAIMDGLNMGVIKAMPLLTPPVDLQLSFKKRLTSVNTMRTTHRQAVLQADALFASLQHRAFRGEL
jgi:type I restriction enzyme S subunit